ncbi:MAG: N-acetylmuramoyl-L-alanine amidase [Bifidobacteriaceae bacterium]|nr:N-acetylmuramoyl-L-alanine amidase [Bifidobacteriaceae bacterium]
MRGTPVRLAAALAAGSALALGAVALGSTTHDAVRPAAAPTAATATATVSVPAVAAPDRSAPPSPAASSTPALPLAGRVVALDPGHTPSGGSSRQVPDGRGGTKACNTSGTATAAGYPEHEFNYDVALRVRERLQAQGATVLLTRDDDPEAVVCVDQRGTFAQDHGAEALVSIHGDGNDDPAVKGFFAIISSPPLNEAQGAPSVELAEAVLERLRAAGFTQNSAYEGGISRRSDIAGVALATKPVVMFELGEMRNPEEAALMSSPDGRQRYAEAVANGVADWLAAHPA